MTPEAVIKLANQLNDEVFKYLNERDPYNRDKKINIKIDPYCPYCGEEKGKLVFTKLR